MPDGSVVRLRILQEPKRRTRKKTIAPDRIPKEVLRIDALLYPEHVPRPKTRGECRSDVRPCPRGWCRHNLLVDVSPCTGSITDNHPDTELWDAGESCALDIAELGGVTLEEVGAALNMTRERVRQIEQQALGKLGAETLRSLL